MTPLVSSGVSSGGWQAIDITPNIAAAGLNAAGITVRGVLLRVHSKLGPIGFSHKTAEAGTWAWGSTTASNVLAAQCFVTTDDSDASQGDYSYGMVPLLNGNNVYYNIFSINSTAGLLGEVHLAGFLYDQVVQL